MEKDWTVFTYWLGKADSITEESLFERGAGYGV
jgi:hypothetical protein